MDLPSITQSILTLHEPDESISIDQLQTAQSPALKRLAFEEFQENHRIDGEQAEYGEASHGNQAEFFLNSWYH